MSVKVRTKDDKKAGWQRSLASRTPKKHNLGAVAWLNFSANATAPSDSFRTVPSGSYKDRNPKMHGFYLLFL